ncbi:hypothetical protein [Streptomyces sp. AC495_CC817]|uniref:hypothetical protein n=1 Tax=Streptomyces sp. AC495_CC817 TaxID=2823900 RepID=UPI001C27734B|nr:hypothetical protein [Streptomyces sp. AC495_CC817]
MPRIRPRPVVLVRAEEEAPDERPPRADGGASALTGHWEVVPGLGLNDPCDEVIEFASEAADRSPTPPTIG